MQQKKHPIRSYKLLGAIIMFVLWSLVLLASFTSYSKSTISLQVLDATLVMLSLPFSLLAAFIDISGINQAILFATLGYVQWLSLGLFIGHLLDKTKE